jgi:hypothetical protein
MQADPLGSGMVVLAILSTILTLVYTFSTGIKIFFGPFQAGLPYSGIWEEWCSTIFHCWPFQR